MKSSPYIFLTLGMLLLYGAGCFLVVAGEGPGASFYQSGKIVPVFQYFTFVCGLSAIITTCVAGYRIILSGTPLMAGIKMGLIIFPCLLISVAVFYAALVFFAWM